LNELDEASEDMEVEEERDSENSSYFDSELPPAALALFTDSPLH
jgi:hypothetical protein